VAVKYFRADNPAILRLRSPQHPVNCSYERAERRAGHRSKAETNATRPEVRTAQDAVSRPTK